MYPGAVFGCPVFTGLEGEQTLQLIDNVIWSSGRHHLKAGVQAYQIRTTIDAINGHDGVWLMPVDRVFDRADAETYPIQFIGATGRIDRRFTRWNAYGYAQDTWLVTDKLTVNLGLRYDYDDSVTAGNEEVDAKNARIIDRYGGGPLLERTHADSNNVAPRLGVVWSPSPSRRTTVRAAAGRFYDQNHSNFNAILYAVTLLADRIILFDANNPFSWAPFGSPEALRSFLARAFPYFPDPSAAQVVQDYIIRNDPRLKTPLTDQLTVGVGRDLGRGFSVDIDCIFAKGNGAPVYVEDNIAFAGGGFVQPDPRFSTILTLRGAGRSTYNAFLADLRYRTKKGTAEVSYTLSKTTSNSSADIFGGGQPTNPLDISEDQGPDAADRRHNLVVNGNYSFPWDVELAGIIVYRSASPYSVTTLEQLDGDPFPDRPEPRNSRRGDAFSTIDVRVAKRFKLGGRMKATLFWEVYNLLNTDNFFSYVGDLASPLFGRPTEAFEKRRQQGGIRIDF
jgi:hypothetical protein